MRFIKSNQQVNSISLRAITGAGFEVLRNYPSCSLRLERICVWLSQATQTLPGPVIFVSLAPPSIQGREL